LTYERINLDKHIHPAELAGIRKCIFGREEAEIPVMFVFDKRIGLVELKDLTGPNSIFNM
jgi:hypothetical protein